MNRRRLLATGAVLALVLGLVPVLATSAAAASPPTISDLVPNSGPPSGSSGGSVILVDGTGFTGATAVHFGSTLAPFLQVESDTELVTQAPPGTGTVDVTVTTPAGTSATTPADQYTYVGAPTVTSISPTSGPPGGGTEVTITGTELSFPGDVENPIVYFGNHQSSEINVISDTQITAVAPAGGGVVDVTVTTLGGTSPTVPADQYTYTNPAVTAISPTSGPASGGTSVTITGINFTGATAVDFGSKAATDVSVLSATKITAVSPASSASSVDVTVTSPEGVSATSPADVYTYLAAPGAPAVTSISPASGPSAGGTVVTITGTDFTGATAVDFGANPSTNFTVVDATKITATAPAGGAGAVDVTVTNAAGTSLTTSSDEFTYIPPPTISDLVPNSGPPSGSSGGSVILVDGSGFTGATAVDFGSTPAPFFRVESDSEMVIQAPPGTGTVDVTVTTPNGTSATTPADQFTYVEAPTVTSISPTSGPPGGGTVVTITGTELSFPGDVENPIVFFGTEQSSEIQVFSDSEISAVAPAGTGVVDVTVTTLGGTSPTVPADQYTYAVGPPSVSVSAPADNASFASDAVPDLAFTCTAGSGGTLKDGTDGCAATVDGGDAVASGTALPGAVGAHTVVVTATDTDGQTASVTRHYTVVGPPTITITSPTDGTTYPDGAVPNSSFSCTAGDGGALQDGLAGCSASIDGGDPVDSGTALPATPGTHTITVTAQDTDGQVASLTYHYTVRNGAPGVTITTPTDNASYPYRVVPDVDFSCVPGDGSTLADGLAGCSASLDGGGPVATGAALPGAVGKHSVAVTATDADGQTSTVTYHYTVTALAPTVTISSPADNASYPFGSVPDAAFSCTAGAGGTLAADGCTATADGTPLTSGDPLPGTVGAHTVVVTATDTDGQLDTITRDYTVTALAPTATLTSPADGASFTYGTVPDAAFSCTAGAGGTLAVDGCTATADGNPLASGDPLPGAVGTHTVVVTALDTDGQNASATATYTVTKAATALTADAAQATLTGPLTVTATLATSTGTALSAEPIVFSADGSTLCTATTNAAGVADCSLTGAQRATALQAGSYSADFAGDASYLPASATAAATLAAIHLPPRVPTSTGTLHGLPAHTTPGEQVTVTGGGFAPGSTVVFGIYSSPRLLGHASADTSGHVHLTFAIPHGLHGTHTVLAAGADQSYNPHYVSATTDISTSTGPGSGGSYGGSSSGSSSGSSGGAGGGSSSGGSGGSSSGGSGGIALTGFDALGFTGLGLLLLLAGAALLRPRRGKHARRTRLS